MPKYQVAIEEVQQYLVLVEAKDAAEAEQLASDYVGNGGVDYVAGSSEITATRAVADDTPGPFPRAEDDVLRDTLPAPEPA